MIMRVIQYQVSALLLIFCILAETEVGSDAGTFSDIGGL